MDPITALLAISMIAVAFMIIEDWHSGDDS
jgi:hypothetical protein